MATRHGGQPPETGAEDQQYPRGLSSEGLTLGAPPEGSVVVGMCVGAQGGGSHLAKCKSTGWGADLWGSGGPQGDLSGNEARICHFGSWWETGTGNAVCVTSPGPTVRLGCRGTREAGFRVSRAWSRGATGLWHRDMPVLPPRVQDRAHVLGTDLSLMLSVRRVYTRSMWEMWKTGSSLEGSVGNFTNTSFRKMGWKSQGQDR